MHENESVDNCKFSGPVSVRERIEWGCKEWWYEGYKEWWGAWC